MSVTIGSSDLLGILPELILTVLGIYLMVQSVFVKNINRKLVAYLGVVIVGLAIIGNLFLIGQNTSVFNDMIRVDRLSVVLNFIFLLTAGFSLLMSVSYSDFVEVEFIEFTPLVLFATVGMMLMGAANHLMIIFLGLETMSISLYIMAGYRRTNRFSLEASLKYFLLGSFATGFLLYGIALLYGAVGTGSLPEVTEYFTKNSLTANWISLAGLGLIIVGFGFKVALVPFHMWTPDVYQGSPMPVTAFMAVGAKAAGFAAILRVLTQSAYFVSYQWSDIFWLLAVLTMFTGNLIALVQDDIKRMLAYSSIAHAGYITVGVVASNEMTVGVVVFYLTAYLFMNLAAFAVAEIVAGRGERRTKIEYFNGLGYKSPMLGLAMGISMFGLAGFPPTAGFIGKFYLFSSAMQSGYVWLVIFGVINSLLSVYYYLRVVVAMYMRKPVDDKPVEAILPAAGVVLLLTSVGILLIGIFPNMLMGLFQ